MDVVSEIVCEIDNKIGISQVNLSNCRLFVKSTLIRSLTD